VAGPVAVINVKKSVPGSRIDRESGNMNPGVPPRLMSCCSNVVSVCRIGRFIIGISASPSSCIAGTTTTKVKVELPGRFQPDDITSSVGVPANQVCVTVRNLPGFKWDTATHTALPESFTEEQLVGGQRTPTKQTRH